MEATLTNRERQVALLMVEGHKREMIGHILGISPNTVIDYARSIYSKLNVHSKVELAVALNKAAIQFHQAHVEGAIDLRELLRRGIRYISVNGRAITASFLLCLVMASFFEPQEQFCRIRSRSSKTINKNREE